MTKYGLSCSVAPFGAAYTIDGSRTKPTVHVTEVDVDWICPRSTAIASAGLALDIVVVFNSRCEDGSRYTYCCIGP